MADYAHRPGTVLDLMEFAPVCLTPEGLCHVHGRIGVEVLRGLETYNGRRRYVVAVATAALEDGLEASEVRRQMALAGFTGVALTCDTLYVCTGASCGC